MNWLRYVAVALVGAAGALVTPEASANAQCTIGGSGLSFGNVDATAGTTVRGYLNYTCDAYVAGNSGNKTVAIKMCIGLSGSVASDRVMDGISPDQLAFQLYKDENRVEAWGSSAPAHLEVPTLYVTPPKHTSSAQASGTIYVYGRIPGQPGSAAGYYARSLTGLLSYGYVEGNGAQLDCQGNGGEGGAVNNFAFPVDATVLGSCSLLTADTAMGFGTLTSTSTGNLTSSIDITLQCTKRTAWQIGLDEGDHFDGTRQMCVDGSTCIGYQLTKPDGQPWGNTLDFDTVPGSSTGNPQTLTVNGMVPDQALTRAGRYTDTIKVTLTY